VLAWPLPDKFRDRNWRGKESIAGDLQARTLHQRVTLRSSSIP